MGLVSGKNKTHSLQADDIHSRADVMKEAGKPRAVLVAAVYENDAKAYEVVERMIREDYAMDRISVLRRAGGEGDDMLGVSFHDSKERIKTWGKQGLFWGGLWGLLASAAGMFVFPGVGPLLMAGPIIEMLGAALAGAAITGSAMAGAAVISELASALHSAGVPEEHIETLHEAIMQGRTLVLLHCHPEEQQDCEQRLQHTGALREMTIPVWH
jgi:hypothetical protein